MDDPSRGITQNQHTMQKHASVDELLKSGAHFGHLTRRWNPKMKEFIFMQRNGIHIIDLKKTEAFLKDALEQVRNLTASGKTILFVGTKKQSREIIKTEAIRCGMPFVTNRWLGGMLTNFETVKRSIGRMQDIESQRNDGTFENLTKKERLMREREYTKLEATLGGIATMNRVPGAVFVVDTVKESIAVNEAVKLNIPIIALADTNSDPDIPDFIIPCNDDSARTIQLITSNIADAILEGMAERQAREEEELAEQSLLESQGKAETEAKDSPAAKTRKRRTRKPEGNKGPAKPAAAAKPTAKSDAAKPAATKEATAKDAPKTEAKEA